MKKNTPPDLLAGVARRLRAVQAELGKDSGQMAAHMGAVGRTTYDNWVNEKNMPAEEALIRLCDLEGLTLDWFYRGIPDGIKLARAIRLTARLLGRDPELATAEVLAIPISVEQMARPGARTRRAAPTRKWMPGISSKPRKNKNDTSNHVKN